MRKSLLLFVVMIFMTSFQILDAQVADSEYRISKTIPLSGDGWWDYLSVDQVNKRLFISHGTQVNVVDLNTLEEIAIIPETNGVHGIAIANDLNKAFISCGMDSSVLIIDLKSFKPEAKINVTGKNPDCILYDSFSKQVFTFNGRSSNATVIDANSYKVLATIPLAGKPEFSQTDGKGKIYVNIEDKSSIAVINAKTLKVDHLWSIAPGEEPSGLALDTENSRLYSVCGNKMMTVTDAKSGKVITTVPIGDGCDGVAFDPGTKRIFASNGEGTVTIIQIEGKDHYRVLDNLKTKEGGRTITVDKSTHHVYISGAEYEPGTGRRPAKPGTFSVLEIATLK